ncbi:MAG TPA: BamA/TamA family outer membrane protein, partial [Longimicrobium sp.]|nr:BamA/TamA family outer membrane protein [Longimicrobium sp.]
RHVYAGERRAVATLEHRAYLGWPYPRLFDLGTAVFVDAGRTWNGGDPFGEDSPVQVAAGAGLRIAFPPGSRQTYRLDIAFPVAPGFRPGSVQVSFGVGQAVGRGAVRDDSQITRSSRRSLSASVFNFPN